jgi:hypothetical protein
MPAHGVGTDSDHLGTGASEDLVAVAEGARLGGTSGGVVLGIEVQDDHSFTEQVVQPDRFT